MDPSHANFEHSMPRYDCPECDFKTEDYNAMIEHIHFEEHN